eukprot:TRINITY_DN4271_c1_g1_i1.p1 TRINITY_DN4271_c1_g1~~TRINITY_DN4271_c1_g1_i1.p1  ORF type:complete len:142 (+),score=10.64 TRINITY_DN4271_c1_g1_i1:90-515(+)
MNNECDETIDIFYIYILIPIKIIRRITYSNISNNFFLLEKEISRVKIRGIVVDIKRYREDNHIKFYVDDGTGVVMCKIFFKNENSSAYCNFNRENTDCIKLGKFITLNGKLKLKNNNDIIIFCYNFKIENNPNIESVHNIK